MESRVWSTGILFLHLFGTNVCLCTGQGQDYAHVTGKANYVCEISFKSKRAVYPFQSRDLQWLSWEPGSQICQRDMTQSRARSCVTWGPNMPFSILIPLCKTAVNNSVLARQGMWAAEVNEWVIAGFTLIDLRNTVVLVKGLWTWVCSFPCL